MNVLEIKKKFNKLIQWTDLKLKLILLRPLWIQGKYDLYNIDHYKYHHMW